MLSISVSSRINRLIVIGFLIFVFFILSKQTFASTTAALLPTSTGTYSQWTPKSGSTHYTQVDEASCNGNTDFNRETTVGQRDSYGLTISSVPDGATITQIDITPCASKNTSGGLSTTFDVFYRLNGVDSADMPGYTLTTTTPAGLSTTSYSGLSTVKNGSTTLEIGGVYTAGNRGVKLSQISAVITYTIPAPTVTTDSAINITQTTATLSSTINPNGFSTTANYRYGTSNVACSSLPNVLSSTNVGSGSAGVSNPRGVATLSANTTYYFCATATNSGGTTNGSVLSFTTLPNKPTVITAGSSSLTPTTASLSGYVTPNGASTDRVFRYGTSNIACSSLPNTTSPVNLGSGTSQIFGTQGVASLSASTTYYFCVAATNAGGTSYGSVFSFTTPSGIPNVTTGSAGSVTSSSATVSATINPNGVSTDRYYTYDTSNVACSSMANSTTPVNIGSGTFNVSPNIENLTTLSASTTYYYCAAANSSAGTIYGSVQSFATAP